MNREITSRKYSPQDTALVRAETIASIVGLAALTAKAATKTDLNDAKAVRKVADAVMQRCAESGNLPNFEILAAALGYSRQGVYKFLAACPGSETASYIDQLRTLWAAARQMAADRGAADTTNSIFILLNSGLGFTNQHQIEISQPNSPFETTDPEAARARIMAALPDDEG